MKFSKSWKLFLEMVVAGQDEINLLTLLIEKWDREHNTLEEANPIRLLNSLIVEHTLKPKDLIGLLGVSKGYVFQNTAL